MQQQRRARRDEWPRQRCGLTRFALGVLLASSPARAQVDPAAAPTDPPPPPKGSLADVYVDGSFGFSLRPPAYCVTIREKKPIGVADVEVVRFHNTDYRWSLTVRFAKTTQPLDAKLVRDEITRDLTKNYRDVQEIDFAEQRIAEREGYRYAASFVVENTRLLRQQAIVRFKPTEYFALVLITLDADRELVRPMFDKIVASFDVLRTEVMEQRITAGLKRGKDLLAAVRGGEKTLPGRKLEQRYLRFVLDGEEVGFVQVFQAANKRKGLTGIEIKEFGWLFNADGSITHLRHDMFLADNLDFEAWENRVTTLTVPAEDGTRGLLVDVEQGLRRADTLVVKFVAAAGATKLRDKVLEVSDTYGSAAWLALLPRLLDLSQPETYCFGAYRSDQRGIGLRTFEVIGPDQVKVDGQTVPAVKILDSEGLVPPINALYVDKEGRLLRVVAGPLEMISTSQENCERKYKAKIEEADELFRRHAPRPKPRDGKDSARP